VKQKIDTYCFENYFSLFIDLVETKSKTNFISFPSNRHTEENEGYKDKIYEKARNNLKFWDWDIHKIGSGEISSQIISSIKIDNNNLIDWRITSKFEKQLIDKTKTIKYEQILFDFYTNKVLDKNSFNSLVAEFGRNYPLIAYLFFIKDKAQYTPISPTNFDLAFDKLGVKNFRTSHNCSWENYLAYNDLLNQVKFLLLEKDIKDVSLLNAHSFVWIVSDIEKQLVELEISNTHKTKSLANYKGLSEKDKEAVVKARIGQGYFRDSLIKYWNKCCVTGCDDQKLLLASHIKPWKDCDTSEARDLFNGLLLIPNLDKLFDNGLISFEDNGHIILSKEFDYKNHEKLGITQNLVIYQIDERHKKYLRYHREHVFKK